MTQSNEHSDAVWHPEERRVAIAGYGGCIKAKRGEFCAGCVSQATGFSWNGSSDRRRFKHDYANKCDAFNAWYSKEFSHVWHSQIGPEDTNHYEAQKQCWQAAITHERKQYDKHIELLKREFLKTFKIQREELGHERKLADELAGALKQAEVDTLGDHSECIYSIRVAIAKHQAARGNHVS